jgi:integrase-like protein
MIAIPSALRATFEERLLEKAIPRKPHLSYIKWLRYYLDFCEKYDFPDANKRAWLLFPGSLRKKIRQKSNNSRLWMRLHYISISLRQNTPPRSSLHIQRLSTRGMALSTTLLTPTDVKEFLTFLVVKRKVSASSQNQAFNALLFLFRHIYRRLLLQPSGISPIHSTPLS